jgi:thioredoxin-related protein
MHPTEKVYRGVLLLFLTVLSCGIVIAQQKKFVVPENIPPFNIILSDGVTSFNADQLDKNKPLMIVYFDPDCGHCKDFTKTIVKNIKQFDKTQIVMIAGTGNVHAVNKFATENGLNKYPSFKIGTEGMNRTVMKFYRVEITPFTAVYNSSGKLIKYYREVPAINELIADLKK